MYAIRSYYGILKADDFQSKKVMQEVKPSNKQKGNKFDTIKTNSKLSIDSLKAELKNNNLYESIEYT